MATQPAPQPIASERSLLEALARLLASEAKKLAERTKP